MRTRSEVNNSENIKNRVNKLKKHIDCYDIFAIFQYGDIVPCKLDDICSWGMGIIAIDKDTNEKINVCDNFDSSG